jgi:hypothetical protein
MGVPAPMASARFCVLSRKYRSQELVPYQTSSWIYLKGNGKDFGALRQGA